MNINKFDHLDNKIPDVKSILKTPVQLVDNEKLWNLSSHFKDIKEKYHFDIEVVNAAEVILTKIDNIVNLWTSKISWELMKSANDENYRTALSA